VSNAAQGGMPSQSHDHSFTRSSLDAQFFAPDSKPVTPFAAVDLLLVKKEYTRSLIYFFVPSYF
jgi:hypothetical protein